MKSALRSITSSPSLLLLSCLTMTLVLSVLLRLPNMWDWAPKHQPSTGYNDIQEIWDRRLLGEHVFPYTFGTVKDYSAGAIEYPTIIGLMAWLVSFAAGSHTSFWVLTAMALTPFAVASVWGLKVLAGRSAVIFAASPLLAMYAYYNWDLLPVAFSIAGLVAWRRDRVAIAAAMFTLGACAKIYPGFLLLPLCLALIFERQFRALAAAIGTTVAVFAVVNLPLVMTNLNGWLSTYRMQGHRGGDASTIWTVVPTSFPRPILDAVPNVTVLTFWAAACLLAFHRARRKSEFPMIQLAAAMIGIFMLFGQVNSPQYALWLLPFLVVLEIDIRAHMLLVVTNAVIWSNFIFFRDLPHGVGSICRVFYFLALGLVTWRMFTARERPTVIEYQKFSPPIHESDGLHLLLKSQVSTSGQ